MEWEYCMEHLRAHTTGWCTAGDRRKVKLAATNAEDALVEVRAMTDAAGTPFPLYFANDRPGTWNLTGDAIIRSR